MDPAPGLSAGGAGKRAAQRVLVVGSPRRVGGTSGVRRQGCYEAPLPTPWGQRTQPTPQRPLLNQARTPRPHRPCPLQGGRRGALGNYWFSRGPRLPVQPCLFPALSMQVRQLLSHLLTGPVFKLRAPLLVSPPSLKDPCSSSGGFPSPSPPPKMAVAIRWP